MAKFLTNDFMILLLATISIVLGCGVMPAGQGISLQRELELSMSPASLLCLLLWVAMVYSTAPNIQAQVPGIASSKGGAQAFVHRLVMQTVFDVLEGQARSALLPDAVISGILGQLEVKVTYLPLSCEMIALDPPRDMDHELHHGELVENDVAKCNGQSGSNVGIGPI
ncbi:hypothetical protein KIN20_029572 [Parelaphostrongylus tenuis]|uniref:Uncharacterized protein n=1 Tax=Parelaphostrongylus tenuis TaxID=148309 RepID=A0AAD5R2K4_PARTN|nr:hypothetical protein KIN20_029572 [Parelaphostrongylus tenuis]